MTDRHKNGYSLLLLCVFLSGAIPAMIYLQELKNMLPENDDFAIKAMATAVLISSLLIGSSNGIVLLPLIMSVFGALSALELENIGLLSLCNVRNVKELLILLLLIPSQFCICNLGIQGSVHIRRGLAKDEKLGFYNSFNVYIIMLAVSMLYAFVHRVI